MSIETIRLLNGDNDIGCSDAVIIDGTYNHLYTGHIEVSENSIRFGDHPGYDGGNVTNFWLLIVFIISGVLFSNHEYTWGILVFFVCGMFVSIQGAKEDPVIMRKDNRYKYYPTDIAKIQVLSHNQLLKSMKQSGLGKLGGAAVGGVLFGGAGAIVGAMASGNSSIAEHEDFKLICIKFHDQSWVTIKTNSKILFMNLVKLGGLKHSCPI